MKTVLLVVGKTQSKVIGGLVDEYVERVGHYMPFEVEVIPDVANTKSMSEVVQKEKEGDAILARIKPGDRVVLLDEKGREYRSVEFADYIQSCMTAAPRRLVFAIGGPYGFAQSVYARADHKVSLSKMTFSHQMIRLVFTEQLYRAMTILRGEPYHHE